MVFLVVRTRKENLPPPSLSLRKSGAEMRIHKAGRLTTAFPKMFIVYMLLNFTKGGRRDDGVITYYLLPLFLRHITD